MENQKYFEVRDTVYSQTFGKGKIVSIDETVKNKNCRIAVKFDNLSLQEYYTLDGRYTVDCPVSLSKTPLSEITNEPIIEYILSFHEAMAELFGNDKVVECELNPHMTCELNNEGEKEPIIVTQRMYESKWRVIE